MPYFNRKISGYKSQDNTAGRLISKYFYITAEELESYANGSCFNCNTHLYLDFKDGNVITNITADRTDNDIGHQLDNNQPGCRACNCSLSDKNSN